jgi:hypothetical protein
MKLLKMPKLKERFSSRGEYGGVGYLRGRAMISYGCGCIFVETSGLGLAYMG